MPVLLGEASISRRAKPPSKSRATPKPVKTPPNAADWSRTKTNWKAVYPFGVVEARNVLHLRETAGEGDEEEEREHQRR